MNSLLFAMVVFAFVGSVTPGPVNLLATSTAVNHGIREASKHVVGASVAYAFVVFLSGSILHNLTTWLPKLELVMQSFGSAFLIYLAFKIFTAPVTSLQSTGFGRSGWWTGGLTQILNPKAWLVAMSGVSLYVIGQDNEFNALVLFTLVSLILCLIGVGVWAIIGRVLAKFLENHRKQRQFNRIMAALLVASVGLIWL